MKMKHLQLYILLFLFQIFSIVAYSEVIGNLSLNISFTNISTNIVTGLYGMTVTSTTTISPNTTTTTSISQVSTTTTIKVTTTTTTSIMATTTTTSILIRESELRNLKVDLNKTNKIIEEIGDFVKEFIKFDENKAKKTTEKVIENINIKYELYIENSTNLTVRVLYNGSKKIKNLLIYQTIPKNFATTTKELIIITHEKLRIVEDDPKILFISSSVEKGREIIIIFSVNKRIKKDIINDFDTIVFADNFMIEINPIFFLLPIIIIIPLFYYLYEKRMKERRYRYSFKKRFSIFFIIKIKIKNLKKRIEEKLRKEKEFRYQYKV